MTTEPQNCRWNRNRIALIVIGLILAGVVVVVVWALRTTPQIGPDAQVFRTVDALFTAVTAKDENRLGECEQKLRVYREAAKLPSEAADELDGIIRKAKSGSWQTAAERLYDFMQGQRREGRESVGENPRHEREGQEKERAEN